MPINCRFDTEIMSRDQFHEVDHIVMRHAFDIQNELGRLCNESIYQAELIHRCSSCGLKAISHFLGGEGTLMQPVEILVGGRLAGQQKMCLLDSETGLHVSSIIRYEKTYQKQLQRLLAHTSLKQMQWVNFSRENIQLITLKK